MTAAGQQRGTAVARGARLIALSAGGGVAITVLGATAAHAGDAESTGNQSDTQGMQTLTVTEGAGPTVGTIGGTVSNGGAAAANTGVNGAEEVDITTGNATSSGNQAQNKLDQAARQSATGGGVTLVDQQARIFSWGGALADTGFNSGAPVSTGDAVAWGSRSSNEVGQDLQIDGDGDALRLAMQRATVGNLGGAYAETGVNQGDDITTGDASAGGNDSTTRTAQSGTITEASLGAALVDQRHRTRNRGGAVANTGWNETTGDDSTNLAQVFQNGELVDESTENDD